MKYFTKTTICPPVLAFVSESLLSAKWHLKNKIASDDAASLQRRMATRPLMCRESVIHLKAEEGNRVLKPSLTVSFTTSGGRLFAFVLTTN